jgi:hypothetical protein
MNRSLLLVICDFLLLSLLALARFDPLPSETAPVDDGGKPALSAEAELVQILKLSLEAERDVQEELEAALAAEREAAALQGGDLNTTAQKLRESEENLKQEQRRRAELLETQQTLETEKARIAQEKISLAEDLTRMREASILERERLRQAQLLLEQQQQELQKTQQAVAAVEKEKSQLAAEKQEALMDLKVAETRQVLIEQQLQNSKLEIEFERQQREEAQQRAASLSEGVKVLAGTSEEIKEEIKQLQPKTASALFTEYKRNRVTVYFETTFPGIFKDRNRAYEIPTILISDSRRTYAILHTDDTAFDLSSLLPPYDRVDVRVRIGNRDFAADHVEFLKLDPRVMVIPVDGDLAEAEGIKVYPLCLEPFRFSQCVLIDNSQDYFGDSSFEVNPGSAHELKVDRQVINALFGAFSPSRGDLVLAQTGEFLGVVTHQNVAALVDHIASSDTLWVGTAFDPERSNTILTKLSRMLLDTP